jgi:hypothetical protein
MLNYAKINDRPRILQDLTGLTPTAFARLLPGFRQAYQAALLAEEAQRETPRQRQPGGGRKARLATNADKLVFILFYFKFYPTQQLLGSLFGLSQGQVNYWVHCLTPILNQALDDEKQLPANKTTDVAQILAVCSDLEFIIDGAERPTQRPGSNKPHSVIYYHRRKTNRADQGTGINSNG